MGGKRVPKEKRRSRTVGLRLTPGQYAWLEAEAARLTQEVGVRITMSAIATRLLTQAMAHAQG